jgi:hypothetical protein
VPWLPVPVRFIAVILYIVVVPVVWPDMDVFNQDRVQGVSVHVIIAWQPVLVTIMSLVMILIVLIPAVAGSVVFQVAAPMGGQPRRWEEEDRKMSIAGELPLPAPPTGTATTLWGIPISLPHYIVFRVKPERLRLCLSKPEHQVATKSVVKLPPLRLPTITRLLPEQRLLLVNLLFSVELTPQGMLPVMVKPPAAASSIIL